MDKYTPEPVPNSPGYSYAFPKFPESDAFYTYFGKCPYCGGEIHKGKPDTPAGEEYIQLIECKVCGRAWQEVWRLVGIERFILPDIAFEEDNS